MQREQLRDHEERVFRLENELEEHRRMPPERGSKSLVIQNYKEKEVYLNYEVSSLTLDLHFCDYFFRISDLSVLYVIQRNTTQ